MVPTVEAASTAEKVHNREEFRQLLTDVGKLPETQRSALLLREMDAMSYEEIAQAMETSVPSVKSLLVRARISLAEASQARQLTCGEVRIDLAEAAEGLRKLSGPVRRHVRDCEECSDFRSQLRSNDKVLAALVPVGPLLALKGFILSKLGLGGSGCRWRRDGDRRERTGAGAVGSVSAALSGSGAAGGIGAIGGAIGTKAVAGVVTAAVITAGAVEVKQQSEPTPVSSAPARISTVHHRRPVATRSQACRLRARRRRAPAPSPNRRLPNRPPADRPAPKTSPAKPRPIRPAERAPPANTTLLDRDRRLDAVHRRRCSGGRRHGGRHRGRRSRLRTRSAPPRRKPAASRKPAAALPAAGGSFAATAATPPASTSSTAGPTKASRRPERLRSAGRVRLARREHDDG